MAPKKRKKLSAAERAAFNRIYCTTFCNYGHRVGDGKPVGHECYILPPEAISAEIDGDFERAIELINCSSRIVHRGLPGKE